MIKIGDQDLNDVSLETAIIQARLAKQKETIDSLNKYLEQDRQKLKELTQSG
jgi:hypothetical protein